MKKSILFLTAAVLALGTGCSEKTEDSAISEPIPESTAEVSQEPTEYVPQELPYREYFPEDFREIDVNFLKQTNDPPVDIEQFDLHIRSGGSKLSKCKANFEVAEKAEVPVEIDENGNSHEIFSSEEEKQEYLEVEQKRLDRMRYLKEHPTYGSIEPNSNALCGDHFCFVLNYDDYPWCAGSHCFDLCEYNIKTGEQQTLFSYDDEHTSLVVNSMRYVNDTLYFTGRYYTEEALWTKEALYRVNDDGTIENFGTDLIGTELLTFRFWKGSFSERLVLCGTKTGEWIDSPDRIGDLLIYEYDFDKGEWVNLYAGLDFPVVSDENIILTETVDRKFSCEIPDKFRLNTDLRGAKICDAGDNMVAMTVSDSINTFLYVYDFEKLERYKYDLTQLPDPTAITVRGKMVYITLNAGSFLNILIPDIGAAFELKNIPHSLEYHCDDLIWCTDGIFYSKSYDVDVDAGTNENEIIEVTLTTIK